MSNPDERRHLLDANVFIEAAKRYYAFDLAPSFWQELGHKAQEGRVLSIDRVNAEIDPNNQELKEWANEVFQRFESTNQDDVLQTYTSIIRWPETQNYTDAAKAEFAEKNNADAWVISYALVKKLVVVTEERFRKDAKRRVPIPNVCQAFNVSYIDTFQMLRDLQISLG